jgi:uncharacterized membrane protein YqaE (UPF0057 family)
MKVLRFSSRSRRRPIGGRRAAGGAGGRVRWAILFQIIGHIPGAIYGIYVVTQEPRTS